MNYKPLTLIALAALCLCLAVPVMAAPVWSAGNYVTDGRYDSCDSVQYNPQTDVYSCYRDINPAKLIAASNEGNGGIAVGSIRAGYSTLSDTIYVRNVLQDVNGTPMIIKVNADATFRIPEPDKGVLAPGNYTATLDNFNLPDETVYFTIAANQQEPTLIGDLNGQAVSSLPAKIESTPVPCEDVYKYVGCRHGDYDFVPEHTEHVWSEWSRNKPSNWNSIPSNHKETRFHEWHVEYRYVTGEVTIPAHYEYVGHNHGDYDLVSSCDKNN